MPISELISNHHLSRKAIIYIRQSTPHQVLSNQESLNLQYALKQRALHLGWPDEGIEIIDTDLGLTGATAQHRQGFQQLLTQVTLGQIGIILSSEVTRLSRNCSDWYPLLDICGFKGCLIADREGIYDPATANGRLLLGLKGTLSEMELHTIRARMHAGLLNKAERGELALPLPVGLVRDELGRVNKHPDREVQQRLALVFETFLQRRTASKVLQHFNQHHLTLPRRDRFGDLIWKPPTVSAIIAILKNPAYAGAFVYGRTRHTPRRLSPVRSQSKRLPVEEWKIRVNDKYPAYISWETFEKIKAMLRDNYAEYDRNKTRGVPRAGQALLHGLLYCGECGHKMMVQYKHNTFYLCNALRQQYGVPVCQNIPGDRVDQAVIAAFFQALSPIELDVYAQAMSAHKQSLAQADHARQQQIERLRYQAALAQRQYNQVDPDNRLVAAELEARWESALRELNQAEAAAANDPRVVVVPFTLTAELKAAFTSIGEKLPQIWDQDLLAREHKKALLRCLIDKIALHRIARDQVQARIIWVGGETTKLLIAVQCHSFAALSEAAEMENLILKLAAEGVADEEIATRLTAQGYRSPMSQTVLTSTVRIIRLKHGMMRKRSQSHPRHITGYLTVTQIAAAVGLSHHYIYDRIHNGTIEVVKDQATGLFLFPDQPATLELFRQLKSGHLKKLRFSKEHQHA
jgi:DNA invertase Pin-like site-specific DNA recombinase